MKYRHIPVLIYKYYGILPINIGIYLYLSICTMNIYNIVYICTYLYRTINVYNVLYNCTYYTGLLMFIICYIIVLIL